MLNSPLSILHYSVDCGAFPLCKEQELVQHYNTSGDGEITHAAPRLREASLNLRIPRSGENVENAERIAEFEHRIDSEQLVCSRIK